MIAALSKKYDFQQSSISRYNAISKATVDKTYLLQGLADVLHDHAVDCSGQHGLLRNLYFHQDDILCGLQEQAEMKLPALHLHAERL